MWLLTSIIQYTSVIVGLKLLTIGTNVTAVFCVQRKKIKSGLEFLLMEAELATHTCSRSLSLFCNAGINFIQNHPPPGQTPGTRLEGSKNPPPGTIIVYKNPSPGTKQGVKSPTPGHKVRKF